MALARFRVNGKFDRSFETPGTVVIDRKNGTISVRPLRSRREYVLLLDKVAEIICHSVIRAEVNVEQRERKAIRIARRRL